MSEPTEKQRERAARVTRWLDAVMKAGVDQDAARVAFNAVRDDPVASKHDRDAFYRALAQESVTWLIQGLRGAPFTDQERELMRQEVDRKLAPVKQRSQAEQAPAEPAAQEAKKSPPKKKKRS